MTLPEFILAFKALEKETKGKCFYCGLQTERGGLKPNAAIFQTRDHVVPSSARGGDRRENKVVCCRSCNKRKEDLTLQEFKLRTGITTFFSETLLGIRIEELLDIEEIAIKITSTRKQQERDRTVRDTHPIPSSIPPAPQNSL